MISLQKVCFVLFSSYLICIVASRLLRPAGSQGHFKNRCPTKTSGGSVIVPLPIKAKSVFTESEIDSSGTKAVTQSGPLSKESKIPDSNTKKIPPSTVWGEGTRNFLVSRFECLNSCLDEDSQTESTSVVQPKDKALGLDLPFDYRPSKSIHVEKVTETPLPQSQDVRKLSVVPKNPDPISEDDKIRIQMKQEEAERLAYEREQQLKREDAKRFREMEVASVTRQGMEDYGTAKVVVNQPTEEPVKPSVPVVNITASASVKAGESSHPRVQPKRGLPRRPPGDTNFYRVVPEEESSSYGSRRTSVDRHEILNDRHEMPDRRGMRRRRYESFDRRFQTEDRDRTERKSANTDQERTNKRFPNSDRDEMKKQPNDTQEKSEKRSSSRPWESDRFRKWSTDRNSHPDRTNRTGREMVESSSRSFSSNSNRSTLQTTKPSKQSQQDNSEFFLEGADYDQYISNQLKWKSIPVTREYHILENGVLDVGVDLDDPVEIPTSEHIEEKSGKEWWRGIIR